MPHVWTSEDSLLLLIGCMCVCVCKQNMWIHMCYGVRGEVRGQPQLMVFAFCFAWSRVFLLLFDAVDTRVAGLGASHLTIGPLEWQMLPSLYPWVLGIRTYALILCGTYITHWAFSQPLVSFFWYRSCYAAHACLDSRLLYYLFSSSLWQNTWQKQLEEGRVYLCLQSVMADESWRRKP